MHIISETEIPGTFTAWGLVLPISFPSTNYSQLIIKSSISQKVWITLSSLIIMAWSSLVTTIFSHVMIFSKNFLYTPVDNQSVRPKTHVTLINKNES